MFSANVFRRLRSSFVLQTFSNLTARHISPLSASSLIVTGGKPPSTRSFFEPNNNVQYYCLTNRCLSTVAQTKDGNLIYTGSLGSAVRGVKLFSYSTSGASLFLMPHILLNTGLGLQSFAMQAVFCGVIGFFTFLTPVLLHLITKGYVIRLYHDPDRDTYTAITYSVFLTEKKNVFCQRQVRIPAVSKMFTTFYANHMGFLVNPDMFLIPHDYNHLMGYDKPFSFNPDIIDKSDKEVKS